MLRFFFCTGQRLRYVSQTRACEPSGAGDISSAQEGSSQEIGNDKEENLLLLIAQVNNNKYALIQQWPLTSLLFFVFCLLLPIYVAEDSHIDCFLQ